ncbi:hypothetical protein O6H91_05G064400 [Diphasiastrum complanatum]|uniref:Uncharacterized protein n=1 Tax=Diphasiastrum complanatum TaxID=34168 RepID=A0ACC2DNX7_DIPCM|nr:hypothetical protein O6H91_05G064400 [Diphasiastrum complanatum]
MLQAPQIRVLILLSLLCAIGGVQRIVAVHAARPATLKIGALLAPHSTIDREAKRSLELAVKHVNANRRVLNGKTLELLWGDTNCSASADMDLISEPVVAIIGPQISVVSHFVAHMGPNTFVPLVSFSPTDSTLSKYQYPYIVRLSRSDRAQMEAIARVVGFFGWTKVVALYSDDEFGTSGIYALSDALVGVRATIVNRIGLNPAAGRDGIGSALNQLAQMGSRILVVHMQPIMGRILFNEAHYLNMTLRGYVWIVSEALSSVLDKISYEDEFFKATQGLIGTRTFIPDSKKFQTFLHEWKKLTKNDTAGMVDNHITSYGLYAYDAIWLIAHALRQIGNPELAKLNASQNSFLLLQCILNTEFTGVTGRIELDKRGDLEGSSIEIVNMVGRGLRTVGYWSNATGCTKHASHLASRGTSEITKNNAQDLDSVIWPGGTVKVPREWVNPNNGKPLLIGVPDKIDYSEFVDITIGADNTTRFQGFCIDVFQAALKYLPYSVPYTLVSYGNGSSPPNYDHLVERLANKEFDAVVGDVKITAERARIVDFTQPYIASGLVVVVPARKEETNAAWAFMRPFTPAVFFLCTGVVVWLLERKKNPTFRGGPLKKQFVTTLWFIFSTLFFSQKEDVKSTLGWAVVVIWLFVVLIITASYTASRTSILTLQQLMPTIQGFNELVASSVPIGYQAGSFVEDYLLQLHVRKERLVPLDGLANFADALHKGPKAGGIGALVEELPYVQEFLSSACEFIISGDEFTKSGWGFAFPTGSQLAVDMSIALLTLAENGELQRLHDKWLGTSVRSQIGSAQLGLNAFWGLFLITGAAPVICLIGYYILILIRYRRKARDGPSLSGGSSLLSRLVRMVKSFISFVHEPEEPSHHPPPPREPPISSRRLRAEQSPPDSTLTTVNDGVAPAPQL